MNLQTIIVKLSEPAIYGEELCHTTMEVCNRIRREMSAKMRRQCESERILFQNLNEIIVQASKTAKKDNNITTFK